MKKYIVLLLVLLAPAIVACGGEGGAKQTVLSDGWGSGELRVIILDDGTRCAAIIGYCKAAIDCDWKGGIK